jgi:hypothetical protein
MAKHRANTAAKKFISQLSVLTLAFVGLLAGSVSAQAAPVALTVSHIGWDVVGLDSNDVTDGPNTFPQGYRVCNTSSDTEATNLEADWAWTSTNNLITLDGNSNKEIGTIAANSCVDFYWTVTVARDSNSYDTDRKYTVSVNDGASASANAGTQLIYVEHLVSQNRNVADGVAGPASVTLGDTVQFVLTGKTATQGYEQIVTAPVLNSSIFEIKSVVSSYAVGGTINGFYVDACGWDPAGVDVSTWNCLGTGKAGGDPITVTVTAKVIGTGTAAVGGVIYDFSGSSFHYNSDYSTGVLTVTASAPVRTITAVDESDTTDVDTAVAVTVLANDTASNATVDTGSVTITQQPTNGTVSVDPLTGKITYTPNSGYTGTDTFKYTIATNEDAAVTDEATVTITIAAAAVHPAATNDSDTTDVNVPVEINVLTNDVAGTNPLDPTSVNVTANPSNGTVSVDPVTGKITYTPNNGYTGTDSFSYEVCDTANPPANCDTAVVTVTIAAVAVHPTATNDTDNTSINTPVEIDVLDNDVAGTNLLDPTSVNVTANPSNGTVSVDPVTGKITYTPNVGYVGPDSFTYEVCDTANPANCDTAVVDVTIDPTINAALPDAVDDSETTPVDTPVDVTVLANDTVAGGTLDETSVTITQQPAHGTVSVDPVSGKVTYTPNSGYTGTDSFKYTVAVDGDANNKDEATVTITINEVVVPPAEEVVVDAVAEVDEKLTIDPTKLDPNAPEIDPTTVEITEQPSNGTVTVDPQTGKITYVPEPGFKGTDSFKFRAASLANPSVFVEFTYNVEVGGSVATAENEKGLAYTGSNASGVFALALLLVAAGSALLVRKTRNY